MIRAGAAKLAMAEQRAVGAVRGAVRPFPGMIGDGRAVPSPPAGPYRSRRRSTGKGSAVGARHAWVVGAAVALIGLAGCGSADRPSAGDQPSAAGSQPIAGPPAGDGSAGGDAGRRGAAPTGSFVAAEAEYLTLLHGLGPEFVRDARGAVENGRGVCRDIDAGKSMAQLAQGAAARFATDARTAQRIVVVARMRLCETAGG